MFSFDNTHIFTGYLKQLLGSVNLPTCKIYTREFAEYFAKFGVEDPRVVESFDNITKNNKHRNATRIAYLKENKVGHLFRDAPTGITTWKYKQSVFFDKDKRIAGLTRKLKSPGNYYDTKTHEYLGEYLRFLRDYYGVNLMSMYNCFSNKTYTNVYFKTSSSTGISATFNSNDNSKYKIYAFPVKLFANYTIAIDCNQGIELFCGLYKTTIDGSDKAINLFNRTYQKVTKTLFNQPFIYDKLDVKNWLVEDTDTLLNSSKISRCDIINREQDLKLFIKVPASCRSSIVVLEGDFKSYNNFRYAPSKATINVKYDIWEYTANHSVINFDKKSDLNEPNFKPISKLQLLALNTGESYPFADRLVEYLSGSAITPMDEIVDNIRRVQKVMNQNKHYFQMNGLWENSIQKIAYDYMINSGPFEISNVGNSTKIVDKRRGYHPRAGYTSKSRVFDILGYIDKDIEHCYSSWTKEDNKAKVLDNIQNVDIYNGLFDI